LEVDLGRVQGLEVAVRPIQEVSDQGLQGLLEVGHDAGEIRCGVPRDPALYKAVHISVTCRSQPGHKPATCRARPRPTLEAEADAPRSGPGPRVAGPWQQR